MANGANDCQVGGDHYSKRAGTVQHWDFVHEAGLGYHDGIATKYLDRFRDKAGRQDLEKAIHYCDKCAELGTTPPPLGQGLAALARYQEGRSDFTPLQMEAQGLIISGAYADATTAIERLIAEEYPPYDASPAENFGY